VKRWKQRERDLPICKFENGVDNKDWDFLGEIFGT
jgi:hypothetical protein